MTDPGCDRHGHVGVCTACIEEKRKDYLQQIDAILHDAGFSYGTAASLPDRLRVAMRELAELRLKADQPAPTETVTLTPCKACGWALYLPSDGKCQRCGESP